MSELKIVSHDITFSFSPENGALPRDMTVRAHTSGTPENVDTIVFMGLGNRGNAPAKLLDHLAAFGVQDVAAVEAFPYEGVDPAPLSLQRFAARGSLAVAESVREWHGSDARERDLYGIGESQAAPSLAWAGSEQPEMYDRYGFLHGLGTTRPMSVVKFLTCMGQTAVQIDQLRDPKTLLAVSRTASQDVFRDLLLNRGLRLRFGLNSNITPEIYKLYLQKPEGVRVFAGLRDKLYPSARVYQWLKNTDPTMADSIFEAIEGSHSSPASRAGARQVKTVVNWARNRKND